MDSGGVRAGDSFFPRARKTHTHTRSNLIKASGKARHVQRETRRLIKEDGGAGFADFNDTLHRERVGVFLLSHSWKTDLMNNVTIGVRSCLCRICACSFIAMTLFIDVAAVSRRVY